MFAGWAIILVKLEEGRLLWNCCGLFLLTAKVDDVAPEIVFPFDDDMAWARHGHPMSDGLELDGRCALVTGGTVPTVENQEMR